jgi:hypothetical protein
MDYLPTIRLAVDTGILVLIWMVQLIIYPAFHVMEASGFVQWHKKYMNAIGVIVIPLMLAQAGCIAQQLIEELSIASLVSAIAVLIAWIVTVTLSAPTHQKLQAEGKKQKTIQFLITTNWLRTIGWTIAFIAEFSGHFCGA